jgi:hypothetical protein
MCRQSTEAVMIGRESGFRSACELTEEGTIRAFNQMCGRVHQFQQ